MSMQLNSFLNLSLSLFTYIFLFLMLVPNDIKTVMFYQNVKISRRKEKAAKHENIYLVIWSSDKSSMYFTTPVQTVIDIIR